MIEDQDDVALLPPGPRGDRNCCALTTTQTWPLTLEMPSVEPLYSPIHRISRPHALERPREGVMLAVSGAFRTRVVKLASSSTKAPEPVVHRRGTGAPT